MRKALLMLLPLLALSACTRATPEQQIVNDAAAALGGRDRVLAVKSLVIQGTGTQYNLGQDVLPTAHGQTFTVTAYRRAIDVANNRSRTSITHTPNFRYFQGQETTKQVQGIDGTVAYNVAANGNGNRAGGTASNDRRTELLHNPLTVVRAALDPMAKLANARTQGSESLVDVTTAGGQTVTLAIDNTTKLPTRVTNLGNNNVLGDVVLSTTFADYKDVSGLKLPAKITDATDDFVTAEFNATDQTVDGDASEAAAPAAAANAPAPAAPAPPMVAVEQMAPGVWFLSGTTHNSMLVEFKDHLTLIELPLSDVRGQAVIAKAKELVPGKPLTTLITTHHHFDHTGGVRAAIAEGLTVITRPETAAMLEEVAKRPHTLVPDSLSKNPKPLKVETVSEDKVITDGTMTLNLYMYSDEHAQNMLYVYLPKQRILWESDLYNQGFAVHPYSTGMLAELKKRNLRVDNIAPGHGKLATWAAFLKDEAAQHGGENSTK